MKFLIRNSLRILPVVIVLTFLFTFGACENNNQEEEPPVFEAHYTFSDTLILAYVNKYRDSISAQRLLQNDILWVVANEHTQNMLSGKVSIGHDGFDSRATYIQKWMEPQGWGHVGENVAYLKIKDLNKVVGYWLTSATHKANLDGSFEYAGVSCLYDSLNEYCFITLILYE